MKRVALKVSSSNGIDVSGLVLKRVSDDITSNVSIRNPQGQNLKTGGSNLVTTGVAANTYVYLTWDKAATDEEIIPAGESRTYYLRGSVSGAASGDSFSAYIPDDATAGSATTTGAGVANLRTQAASSAGVVAAASVNGTRQIWRWASATTIYLDVNGSADYEAASDYLVVTETTSIGDAAYTVDQIIPGVLRYDSTVIATAGDGAIY